MVNLRTPVNESDFAMTSETIDVAKPKQMIGSLWVWWNDGVLYKCVRYDDYSGTYYFEGVADPKKTVTCLYSFLPFKMGFIKGAH